MPPTKETNNKTSTGTPQAPDAGRFCHDCFGRHPNHKAHCAWTVDSAASKAAIIPPEKKDKNSKLVRLNGGYIGKAIVNNDLWGMCKKNPAMEGQNSKADNDVNNENEWVKVEGEWVEM